jgi:DNA-binding LacI/PurR family transcriptional regulator
MIRQINKQQRPFVLLQQEIDDKSINTICIKNKLGAYEATRHLLNLGYKDLALITGPESSPDSQDKLAGANMALAEAGMKIPPENILEGHHVASYAVNAFRQRFADSAQLPEAIFCFNDDMAIALLYWLREHNIRVPEDIALVGYDGISEAKYLGLTTIETPMYEMGVLAAQRLIEIIEDPSNEDQAKQITLTGQLCVRETCGASKQTLD